jgi:hypothetical protein
MPSLFSRLKGKDGAKIKSKKNSHLNDLTEQFPPKPRWEDAWTRNTVEPDEVQELIRGCTNELKARGMTSISLALQLSLEWGHGPFFFFFFLSSLFLSLSAA